MKTAYKRIMIIIVSLLLSLSAFPANTFARGKIDENRKGSITLSYPVQGVEFRLYRVGNITGSGQLSLTEEYRKYQITLNQKDQSGWETLAETVDGYITADQIHPLETKTVNPSGKLTFDTKELGVYLITWDSHITNGKMYEAQPFFLTLPSLNEVDETWIYDVTPKVKYTISDEKFRDIHVHKAWKDQKNAKKKRPKSIKVQLLCDGTVKETVELTEENSWSYDWKDMEASHDWKVVEKEVPSGYTVKVTKEGTTFLITNTTTSPHNPPHNPPRLPQTGMLWWPVPILALAGLGLFLIGWILRKRI